MNNSDVDKRSVSTPISSEATTSMTIPTNGLTTSTNDVQMNETTNNDENDGSTQRIELRIDEDPVGISASELAGNLSPPSLDYSQTYPQQPGPCERCANYRENAERAYKVVEAFARKRQETQDLQKQLKDISSVLDERQDFMLDLQKKLEQERAQKIEVEKRLLDVQVELDCTKDQLKFVQEESDKNKTLVEKTTEHERKLSEMQRLFEQQSSQHESIRNRMFTLAKVVAQYQKQFGKLNTNNLQQEPEENTVVDQVASSSHELSNVENGTSSELKRWQSRAKRPRTRTTKKKPNEKAPDSSITQDMLLGQLDSDSDAKSQSDVEKLSPIKRPSSSSNNDIYSTLIDELDSDTDAESHRSLSISLDDSDMPTISELNTSVVPESNFSPPKRMRTRSSSKQPVSEPKNVDSSTSIPSTSKAPKSSKTTRSNTLSTTNKTRRSSILSRISNAKPSVMDDDQLMPPPRKIPKRRSRFNSSSSSIDSLQHNDEDKMSPSKIEEKPLNETKPKSPQKKGNAKIDFDLSDSEESDNLLIDDEEMPELAIAEDEEPTTSSAVSTSLNETTTLDANSASLNKSKTSDALPSTSSTASTSINKTKTSDDVPTSLNKIKTPDDLPTTSSTAESSNEKVLEGTQRSAPRRLRQTATRKPPEPVSKIVAKAKQPLSPKRALLIDIPMVDPQKTRTRTAKSNSKFAITANLSKQPNKHVTPFNFIGTLLKEVCMKRLSVTDGVKRFNAELQRDLKTTGQRELSVDQLADVLVRFIRAEEVGDLWLSMKRNANSTTNEEKKDAVLSSSERIFFEFIYAINEKNEKGEEVERWPGIFMRFTEKICSDCSTSPASSHVQKCRDYRVILCALFFSEQQESIEKTVKNQCIRQIVSLFDELLTSDDSMIVVRIFSFAYTTNGSFLLNHLLSLATAPVKRLRAFRSHLAASPNDANIFFKLVQNEGPDFVESLKQSPETIDA